MSHHIAHTRIPLIKNPKYKRSGLKSYVWLLGKYNIQPTQSGPYFRSGAVHTQGKFGAGGLHDQTHAERHKHHQEHEGTSHAVGGRTKVTPGGSGLQKKFDSGTTGAVTAEDQQNDSEYLCSVSIGTPPQTVLLDFDTGSSDLWVFSTELPAATLTTLQSAKHNIFDPTKSTSYKKQTGSTWSITYGDGSSASGDVGLDTLHLGGINVENQAIELANKASSAFTSGASDGLLGLAWPTINTVQPTPVATPVENMITQKDIPATAELFTANLGSTRDTNDPDKGQSFYTFGYIDADTLTAAGATESSIFYTPLVNQDTRGFWEFASTTATVNGKTIQRENQQTGGNSAIADTGTTLALVDDTLCKAIYGAIPGAVYDSSQQGWTLPSNTTEANLPVIQFAVGAKLFTVQKEDLLFAEVSSGVTYGGIQSRGTQTFDIFGDTFLKNVYAIFDQGNKQFGAVQRTEPTQNLTPAAADGGS